MLNEEERKNFIELKKLGLFNSESEYEDILNVERRKDREKKVYKTEKVLVKTKIPNRK